MKLSEALIAYTPGTDNIRVGPLVDFDGMDWTNHPIEYENTCGAAYKDARSLTGADAVVRVLSEFIALVVRDRVDIDAAHRAFCQIDEYRSAIPSDMDCADPDHTN